MKEQNLNLRISGTQNFDGDLAVFIYDKQGNLLARNPVKEGKAKLNISEKQALKGRVFIAPQLPEEEEPSLKMMERINAYEPVLRPGMQADIQKNIRIPGSIINYWDICFCWIKGRVLKEPEDLPVCGARVHICEVDRLPRFIIELPEPDIFRFRDDLLRELLEQPRRIPEPPRPQPDPPPFEAISSSNIESNRFRIKTKSESEKVSSSRQLKEKDLHSSIDGQLINRLTSNSATIVRSALLDNIDLIYPYFCLWPWWWRLSCDEIRVLETDSNGRFESILIYSCSGDKPDLYFWVEYNINGSWETVYKPTMACNTYWNYSCGTEVTIRISDERVAACSPEGEPPTCGVQIMSIGRNVSISEIQGPGYPVAEQGLTTGGNPFGGKLEPRVWFSRNCLREEKNIEYYRWSFRQISQGDGTSITSPGPWTPFSRTVVRHYARPLSGGGVVHEPVVMGPKTIGSESNLFEIRPDSVPTGGIEWTVVDEREDLASGHFLTSQLGTGDSSAEKAEDAAGRYELKLELFDEDGNLVNWTDESIDAYIANEPAPFGTDPVTPQKADDIYYKHSNTDGDMIGFRMVLHIDNNSCEAKIKPISGSGLTTSSCGFIEFEPGASVNLGFEANHPNNFATLNFNLTRGVSDIVSAAGASGRVGSSTSPYSYSSPDEYEATFPVTDLLGSCDRAAFAENLHVRTLAQNGYHRLSGLDRHDAAGFALTEPCPECDCEDEEN